MSFTPTYDPNIVIEEQQPGRVVYRRLSDGRRWVVNGFCDRRGDCLIGLVEPVTGEQIRDHAHIEDLKRRLGAERLVSLMDTPVTPEFDMCCGSDRFTYEELEPVVTEG